MSPPAPSPRRFGEEGGQLTYGGYLRLAELLAQQVPQAGPPVHDELLFITVHRIYEPSISRRCGMRISLCWTAGDCRPAVTTPCW
jgi:hypothetical protein